MAKESSPKQKLNHAQKAYLSRIKNLVSSSSSFQSLLLQVREQGKNYVRQTERLESKKFDGKFVDELEKGFNAIDQIIANPRTFIKESPELVEAGLAKKINAQSITHLASHTQFVHSVDEKGNVTPEKILTIHAEIDMQIYENRFVMTLIKKCSLFIEKRFNFIKDHGETLDSDLLLIKSVSDIDGAKYEIDSRIKVSTPSKDGGNKEKNEDVLQRLASLRERCAYYMRSPFMAEMQGAKDVANPIHMTNLIVKNPHYHAAYELWKFVDAYTELGVSYNVQETEQDFSQPYFEEILALVMADILTLRSNRVKNKVINPKKSKDRVVNPNVVFNLEDETYYDGKFLYDQFPAYKKKRYSPMALTPEEAKKERLALEENLREERYKKTLIDEEIEKQKNKDIAKEAVERQKKLEAEEKARIKAEKAKEKELAKQKALEERKRKAEDKKALLKEQKELEKTRRSVTRQAKNDKKAKLEPLIEKPTEEVLPVEEKRPIEEIKPEEKKTEEAPVILSEETPKEQVQQSEPIEETKPSEEVLIVPLPEKEETPVVNETPKEEVTDPAVEPAKPIEEVPQEIIEQVEPVEEIKPSEDTPIEPQKEELTNEEVEPSKPIEENAKENEPLPQEAPKEEPLPPIKEKKERKKPSSKKKKETKPEEKKATRKPRKKKESSSDAVNLPLLDESKPVVDSPNEEVKEPTPVIVPKEIPEPVIEEKPSENVSLPEKEPTPASLIETKKEEAPKKEKEKFVRNVPTFRAEKNYVFIKTRKSPKAKKVVLKGKLK